jgi:hypothetical protein
MTMPFLPQPATDRRTERHDGAGASRTQRRTWLSCRTVLHGRVTVAGEMHCLPIRALWGAVLGLALSACAAVAPEPTEHGDARDRYASGAHQALLAWLDHEWKLFGDGRRGHVVDLRQVGAPAPPRWAGDSTPERRLCPHIRDTYWAAVPGTIEHSEMTPQADRDPSKPPVCDNAWSAVFVSAALRNAGVEPRDFRFDPLHSAYLKDILHRYRAWEAAPDRRQRPLFVPHPLETRVPQPGDLICATRRGESEAVLRVVFLPSGPRAVPAWDAALDAMNFGHCDIVVAVDRKRRTLSAIGGNVQDTVTRSLLPIDTTGHLVRTIERPWFIVVENRLP